ncbi:MAG: hypothetical protein KDK08_00110, partial [Rhizobiaceae bacterium]|nr:hypothetical protein [Rhizobiaceae bacterium]
MNQQTTFSSTLVCLGALRRAREQFFDSVVEHAEGWRTRHDEPELTREERKLLRSESTAQIAEFFFLIEEGGINTPDSLTAFFERHNAAMEALLKTCERGYTRFGLSQDRIEKAKFSKQQIEYVLHESSRGIVTLD